MIIEEGTEIGRVVLVINTATCGVYGRVKSFDTETCEAEIYVLIKETDNYNLLEKMKENYNPITIIQDNRCAVFDKKQKKCKIIDGAVNEIVIVKVTLPYAVAINKNTGEEIK